MPLHAIDWEAIHLRLAAAAAVMTGEAGQGADEVCRVLEARARVAAKPPLKPDESERLEVLAFTLAGESYGVETRHVVEVRKVRELTPLPCTPRLVAGVLNLRGQILAVLDLRVFFELPGAGLTELNRVIVLRGPDTQFGLLADAVDGVRSVAVSELQEGLPTLTGVREQFLRGITGQMLAVLDGDRLLTDAALKVNEQAVR